MLTRREMEVILDALELYKGHIQYDPEQGIDQDYTISQDLIKRFTELLVHHRIMQGILREIAEEEAKPKPSGWFDNVKLRLKRGI